MSKTGTTDRAEVTVNAVARLRVLHIEDNPSDLELMQQHLNDPAQSLDFDNAAQLADVTRSRVARADCALLDLSLPDASGLEALQALRQMSDRLPIIVLTGLDDMELGVASVREGADDYLVKNHVDGYTLQRAVRYAMERRSLLLRRDTTIAEDIATDTANLTVGATMKQALQRLQQSRQKPEPNLERPDRGRAHGQDRRARELELELQGESGDWVDHELASTGQPLATRAALAELRLLILDDQRRNAALLRILQLAKRVLPGLVDASITVIDGDQLKTIVFTGPLAVELDERQLDEGFGPCTDAALTVETLVVATAEENPYPHISLVARRAGVTHIVSHALLVSEGFVGALNLYFASGRSLDPTTVLLTESFAIYAAVVVADAGSHRDATQRATQMQEALRVRGNIEMAKGIIMVQNHCSSMEAFETLTSVSQHSNRTIGDVATTLVTLIGQNKP